MKNLSSNIQTLLDLTDNLNSFLLVKIVTPLAPPNDLFLHTTLPYNITISGLGTFSADNGLAGIDLPQQTASVDRESFKITYMDPLFYFRDLFDTGLTGSEVFVWGGLFNTSNTIIGGVNPGDVFSNQSDLSLIYNGVIDTVSISTNDDEKVLSTLECSSPMIGLAINKAFRTSQDFLKQFNPIDSAFDFVYVGSKEVDFLWGKAGTDNDTGGVAGWGGRVKSVQK